MTFKTSLDKLAKIVTTSITFLFLAIIIAQFSILGKNEIMYPISTTILLSLIYFGVLVFKPISYQLTSKNFIIHRIIGDVKIPYTQIKHIENLEDDKLANAVRIIGVAGLFGYWGKFSNSKIGTMTWYATKRKKAVLISTVNEKKIVITPDYPEKFVYEYNKFIS